MLASKNLNTNLLADLLNDVLDIIFKMTDMEDLYSLRSASKQFNKLANNILFDFRYEVPNRIQSGLLERWSKDTNHPNSINLSFILATLQHPDFTFYDRMKGMLVIANNENIPLELDASLLNETIENCFIEDDAKMNSAIDTFSALLSIIRQSQVNIILPALFIKLEHTNAQFRRISLILLTYFSDYLNEKKDISACVKHAIAKTLDPDENVQKAAFELLKLFSPSLQYSHVFSIMDVINVTLKEKKPHICSVALEVFTDSLSNLIYEDIPPYLFARIIETLGSIAEYFKNPGDSSDLAAAWNAKRCTLGAMKSFFKLFKHHDIPADIYPLMLDMLDNLIACLNRAHFLDLNALKMLKAICFIFSKIPDEQSKKLFFTQREGLAIFTVNKMKGMASYFDYPGDYIETLLDIVKTYSSFFYDDQVKIIFPAIVRIIDKQNYFYLEDAMLALLAFLTRIGDDDFKEMLNTFFSSIYLSVQGENPERSDAKLKNISVILTTMLSLLNKSQLNIFVSQWVLSFDKHVGDYLMVKLTKFIVPVLQPEHVTECLNKVADLFSRGNEDAIRTCFMVLIDLAPKMDDTHVKFIVPLVKQIQKDPRDLYFLDLEHRFLSDLIMAGKYSPEVNPETPLSLSNPDTKLLIFSSFFKQVNQAVEASRQPSQKTPSKLKS